MEDCKDCAELKSENARLRKQCEDWCEAKSPDQQYYDLQEKYNTILCDKSELEAEVEKWKDLAQERLRVMQGIMTGAARAKRRKKRRQ